MTRRLSWERYLTDMDNVDRLRQVADAVKAEQPIIAEILHGVATDYELRYSHAWHAAHWLVDKLQREGKL